MIDQEPYASTINQLVAQFKIEIESRTINVDNLVDATHATAKIIYTKGMSAAQEEMFFMAMVDATSDINIADKKGIVQKFQENLKSELEYRLNNMLSMRK